MPHGPADQPKSAAAVNVYWRRRVIALVAGLGMLALVTWTVNGALGGGNTPRTTDLSQTTGHHSAPPAPGSGSATPGTVPSSPGPSSPGPSRAGAGGPGAPPSSTGKPTSTPSSSARHHAAAGACSGANLVLSLSSARYSYPAHARPQFAVSVVSTARGRCTAVLGAAHLHIRIRAGGKSRVWDSADCTRSAAPRVTTLARGIPVVIQFTWNRTSSAPGCRAPHRTVRPGTYTATAYTGNRSSRPMIFVLKGRGIAVP